MAQEDIEALARTAGTLFSRWQRQADEHRRQHDALMAQLRQAIHTLPTLVQQSADAVFGSIPSAVKAKLDTSLDHALTACSQRIDRSNDELQTRTQQMRMQFDQLRAQCNRLIWKSAATAIGSLTVVILGGGLLLWYYQDQLRQNQISAQLMQAYNQADVVLCDGQLCVNVDKGGPKYGVHGQYQRVKPR